MALLGQGYSLDRFSAFAANFWALVRAFRFNRLIRKASASRLVSAADRGVRGFFAIPADMERRGHSVKP
jgi:hypothetical protein